MYKIIIPSIFLSIAISFCGIAQNHIYNSEVPEIEHIWTRVADFSPKLRAVESAEISNDGMLAVSGSKFGYKVMLWNVPDGSLIWTAEHESEVECVTFSPDDKRIATGGEDYFVRIWDVETGKEIKSWEHPSGLDGITWSHDGTIIASGSEDGEAYFWDAETYDLLWKIKVGSTINSLNFTLDDKRILIGGNIQTPDPNTGATHYTGFARLVDMQSKNVIRSYGEHTASVKSVRISGDEQYIATGGFANEAKLFEMESGKELKTFSETMRVEAVAFTNDSQYLVTGGHNKRVTFYRLSDLEKVLEVPCPRVEYIDFSKDGRLMLTAHEDSGLINLYMVLSNMQHKQGLYQKVADDQLNNRDLKH
ncbi:MAG: WD40 repeat domain-containing protein [Cyclobacteriaceae bacterium]|nr:WD40 repeat domain-containing protein [Cyclobacteriaceae bacterium]